MTKIVFDENTLTIGDLEDFEDAIGMSLTTALKPIPVRDAETGEVVRHDCRNDECEGAVNDDGFCRENGRPLQTVDMKAKVLKGLIWIANRQENPEFTLADARNVKVTELDIVRLDDEGDASPEADPKD